MGCETEGEGDPIMNREAAGDGDGGGGYGAWRCELTAMGGERVSDVPWTPFLSCPLEAFV